MSSRKTSEHYFVPAFFVAPIPNGQEFEIGKWPAHITMFPPLKAEYDLDIGQELKSKLNQERPFEVKVGDNDMFGHNKDIPVQLIQESEPLQLVHRQIQRSLAQFSHDDRFIRPYNPHITKTPETERLKENDIIHIGGFAIAQTFVGSTSWRIVDKIGFKGGL